MKYKCLILLIGFMSYGSSQTTIQGHLEFDGKPINMANITLVGSYDGATSNSLGNFSFKTSENGSQAIKIAKKGYDIEIIHININQKIIHLDIELKPIIGLNKIFVKAGEKESKTVSNQSLLKPFDVITTAGSMGDNIAALQMQPGTQSNADGGRLFVRGGDPLETQTYIDGLKVYQPYTATAPQTPVRGRFSPFLFKGIQFSTGGYQNQFGNAMSGVLNMQTIDFPQDNKVDISFSTVGANVGINRVGQNNALSFNTNYQDLTLYQKIFKTKDEWISSPKVIAGETVYRQKLGNALWKTYLAYDYTQLKLIQKNIQTPQGAIFGVDNNNIYINSSVLIPIKKRHKLRIGGSFSSAKNKLELGEFNPIINSKGAFARIELKSKISALFKIKNGITLDYEQVEKNLENQRYKADNVLSNFYSSFHISAIRNFELAGGLRGSYADLLQEWVWQPRLSLAYQIKKGQDISLIFGRYHQLPQKDFWVESYDLKFQKASQFLLNYKFTTNKNVLRFEMYYKQYQDLITYNRIDSYRFTNFQNQGEGYAKGFDVFWRNQNGLVSPLDFWISYSYVDSERKYQDYPSKSQPNYVSNHNLSWVNKYWFSAWRSQISLTYRLSSGKPYTNPNKNDFLGERSKPYQTVDLGWAYVMAPQKLLYLGINNVFNIKNNFGYRYANMPDTYGIFASEPILPQNNQFFYIGFFWTISTNKSKNQLNQL